MNSLFFRKSKASRLVKWKYEVIETVPNFTRERRLELKAQSSLKSQIGWFVSITFILTYGLGLFTYFEGGLDQFPLTVIMMFIPMLVALFVQKFVRKNPVFKGGELGLRIGNWRYLLIAPLAIFSMFILVYAITFILDSRILLDSQAFTVHLEELLKKNGLESLLSTSAWIQVGFIILINVFVGTLLMLPLFLGEEIGWRAFLVPKLVQIFRKKGLIIGGAIWGFWHLPAIMMGHNYPNNPIIGSLLFTVFTISMGIILQYFYQNSQSGFTVALCHGVMNRSATTIMMLYIAEDRINTLIHGPTGFIGILVLSVLAVFFYRKYDAGGDVPEINTISHPKSRAVTSET